MMFMSTKGSCLTFSALTLASFLLTGCGGESCMDGNGGTFALVVPGPKVSNLPQATFTVAKTADAADLDLLSSNLVPDPNSTLNFIQWFAEAKNNGTTAACFVQITINFKTAGGGCVKAMHAYADSDTHKIDVSDTPIPCIPPGKSGVFYDNDLPAAPVNLASIGRIEAQLTLIPYPGAVLNPSNPTLSSVALVPDPTNGDGYWAIMGTLTATATIYNIGINGYYKNRDGMILDRGPASNLGTVAAGASWAFTTFYYVGAQPSSYLLFVDYLLGAGP
jgi:hypothetical protein